MRLERLENQYGDIPLMYCQRELLRVLGIFKDDLVEKCQDFKEFEEQSSWSNCYVSYIQWTRNLNYHLLLLF